MTCDGNEEEWEAIYTDFQAEMTANGLASAQMDFSGVTTTIVEQKARRTVINLSGELGILFEGERYVVPVNDMEMSEIPVIVQSGRWVVC